MLYTTYNMALVQRTVLSFPHVPGCSATEAAAAQKEAEDAHEQYDRSKGQLRILEEEQLRAEEAREQVEQSLQALASKEADMARLQT